MTQIILISLSSTLILINPIFYARAMFKGNAIPHRTTLFVIALLATISAVALFAAHDKVAIYLAAASAIQSTFLFILSIKYGMGGWEKTDLLCLVIALIGIVLWRTTENPLVGLYFAILADFAGMVPTILKTIKWPQTEILSLFVIDIIAAVFSLLALNSFKLAELSYPLYILHMNLVMAIIMVYPRKSEKAKT